MIMPCMNSTSAGERGGSVPFVDGGKVLVGWPGAPGCTPPGAEESRACDLAGQQKKTTRAVASSNIPHNRRDILADWSLRLCRWAGIRCGLGAKPELAY